MDFENRSARIAPVAPPYSDAVGDALRRLMGTDEVEPLLLFRTIARHEPLLERFRQTGSTLLSHGRLADDEREALIHRTTARCGAGYEWGVHAARFAGPLGLDAAWLTATWSGAPDDPAFTPRQRLLVRLADELHDTGHVSAGLWAQLADGWPADQLVEAVATCGFYHLVAFCCGAFALAPEPWAVAPPARTAA
jgi:4-carboxymuconolactone decarboxylase